MHTARRLARVRWLAAACCGAQLLCACSGTDNEQIDSSTTAAMDAAEYVGGQVCATCHVEQNRLWQNSHHDLAMQLANDTTVLGDFDQASYDYNGITSEFFRRDSALWVRTDGADGDLADFRVAYAFGVEPLQQYLLELPGGRLQVLSIAWDTRPATEGGQRWFHLYPEEAIDSRDPLHWTGIFQNWNTSCASCHSTNLRKNYSSESQLYATSYSSIDVDCEACHGPGSLHAAMPGTASMLLPADKESRWEFTAGSNIAQRVPARSSHAEIETCAQCHSRRGQLVEAHPPAAPLLDAFRPAFLDSGLYQADGQILDEVYVYGSFLQSKMYAAGVSCSDCHEPHSGRLMLQDNALCSQCHLASVYDVAAHHHHEPGNTGARCINCHMPERTYMVVDPRRDHSFRVPRPDLSQDLQVSNSCTACHAQQGDAWATAQLEEWFPAGRGGSSHYGNALAAGRNWSQDRAERLLQLLGDIQAPAIVRATALGLLAEQMDNAAFAAILQGLQSDSNLLQLAALDALSGVAPENRIDPAQQFLDHPVLALRMTAARLLVPVRGELRQEMRSRFERAIGEYRASQTFNSDRADGLLNLAGLNAELGEIREAESTLQAAIEREPWFTAAYVNLADLYRQSGRDTEALSLLTTATQSNPEDAAAWLALGLAETRAGRSAAALDAIRHAAELAPGSPYYQYVAAIAQHSPQDSQPALQLLEAAHARFPGYRDITFALATMNRDAGNTDAALAYARELLQLSATDPAALGLIAELQGEAPRTNNQ